MMHALFFDRILFLNYFPKYKNLKYIFKDTDGIFKLRGPAILKQVRNHFKCSKAKGGNFYFSLKKIKIK